MCVLAKRMCLHKRMLGAACALMLAPARQAISRTSARAPQPCPRQQPRGLLTCRQASRRVLMPSTSTDSAWLATPVKAASSSDRSSRSARPGASSRPIMRPRPSVVSLHARAHIGRERVRARRRAATARRCIQMWLSGLHGQCRLSARWGRLQVRTEQWLLRMAHCNTTPHTAARTSSTLPSPGCSRAQPPRRLAGARASRCRGRAAGRTCRRRPSWAGA